MRNINYSFLPNGSVGTGRFIEPSDLPVVDNELTRMCKLVFAIHPVTNMPTSDLSVLFSDSVPADIADWVRKNLQQPIDVTPSSIINGEQVDDETLMKLVRNVGEDDRSYIKRVDGLLNDMFNTGEGS